MNPNHEHSELKELILENQRLLAENNELLKKMHRSAVRHFWLNILWIALFLGLPLIAFYKFVMPLYSSFGGQDVNLDAQIEDIQELRNLLENQR